MALTATGHRKRLQKQFYPNPAGEVLNIVITAPAGYASLRLFSSDGRLVKTVFEKDLDKNDHIFSVSRDGIPSGNYFIVLQNKSGQVTKPVIFR